MAGAMFKFDADGFDAVTDALRQAESADLLTLMIGLSAEGESQTRRRISQEKTGPEGNAWTELSEAYAERKARRKGDAGLLEYEGDMLDSVTSSAGTNEAAWGSNKVYFAIHNFGGEMKNGGEMPQREVLGLSADNVGDMEGIAYDWAQEYLI